MTTTLGGNSAGFTGATTINGGTMLVNNFFGNSAFTVNTGATLGGSGTVGTTTLAAGAALSPGNSIDTITVNGDLTFNAGSTYVVEVSPTAADRTNVTGTANLAGTVQAVFLPGAFNSNSYVILSAGTRNGTFDTLTTVGLPSYLTASLDQTSSPTDVLLLTVSSNIQLLGTTRNQIAVAGALDAAFNNGQGLFPGFGGLAPNQIPGALNALTGELYPTAAGILLEQSTYVRNAIFGRLRQTSAAAGGGATAALATGGPQLAFAQDPMQAYAASMPVKAPPQISAPASDTTAWATAFGSWGKVNTDGNAAEAKRDLAGFVAGFDKRFGNWTLGAATGYSSSDIRVSAVASKADVETFHVAGYAGGNVGGFNLRFGAAYAYHDITGNRTAAFPGFFDQLRAKYDGYTAQVFGEAGYAISLGRRFAIEPFAGLAAVSTRIDSFAETGGAAALAVAGENISAVYSSLGIRAAANIVLSHDKTLVPRMTVAWQHAFDDVTPSARMAFIGTGAAFTATGLPIAQDSLLVDVGADLLLGHNVGVSLSYVGQLADDAQDHAVKARGTWVF